MAEGSNKIIGDRVRGLREARKERQEDIAEMLGVEPASVSRKEGGQSSFKLSELVLISKHYNATLDWLITGEEANGISMTRSEHNLFECYKILSEQEKKDVYDTCIELALFRMKKA